MTQLDVNDSLKIDKALLFFMQILLSTDTNSYFSLKPIKNNNNWHNYFTILVSAIIFNTKLIYQVHYISSIRHFYISLLVASQLLDIFIAKNISVLHSITRFFFAFSIFVV